MALPTHSKDDHVINWVGYECIHFFFIIKAN